MLDSLLLPQLRRSEMERATADFEAGVYDAADFLKDRGISEAQARAHRLGVASEDYPGFERFAGMMSIPFLTPAGVVAIKFRCISCWPEPCEDHPKYNAPEGQQVRLYNVPALHSDGDVVAICEGELDALVMTELVGIPAVGVPGVSQWKAHPWWARAFADYEEVLVIADNDLKESGKNPGLDAARKIAKDIPGSRVVIPPPGLDLNDWYLTAGREAVREACGV